MFEAIHRWENEGGALHPVEPAGADAALRAPTIIIEFNDCDRGRDALALARSLGHLTGGRIVAVTSSSAKALHEAAEREQADLIVVSASGAEHGTPAHGADQNGALHGAPCAVALAPAGFARVGEIRAPIGVGFDGSWESRLALAGAAGLADSLGGGLRVIAALRRPAPDHPMFAFISYHHHLAELRDEARSRLIGAVGPFKMGLEIDPVVVEGEPADVLVDQSPQLGLLVIGSRGYGPLRRVLLGSVSHAVIGRAKCPVVIVPRGAEPHLGPTGLNARLAHSH